METGSSAVVGFNATGVGIITWCTNRGRPNSYLGRAQFYRPAGATVRIKWLSAHKIIGRSDPLIIVTAIE